MFELTLNNGLRMPVIGLGTWQMTGDQCISSVKKAIGMGYRHIDTAEAYGNEKQMGEAIGETDRKDLFITTKVFRDHLDYGDLIRACDSSLRRLGTDYVDLYLIHWPNSSMDLEKTLGAMKELYAQGKAKAVGVSNFTTAHLEEALRIAKRLDLPISANQVECHPGLNQQDLLDYCKDKRIQVIAYSPIARGKVNKSDVLRKMAAEKGKTPAQVALRWAIDKGMAVIPKATSIDHLEENLAIFDFELSRQDIEKIDSIGDDQRLIDPAWSEFGDRNAIH